MARARVASSTSRASRGCPRTRRSAAAGRKIPRRTIARRARCNCASTRRYNAGGREVAARAGTRRGHCSVTRARVSSCAYHACAPRETSGLIVACRAVAKRRLRLIAVTFIACRAQHARQSRARARHNSDNGRIVSWTANTIRTLRCTAGARLPCGTQRARAARSCASTRSRAGDVTWRARAWGHRY